MRMFQQLDDRIWVRTDTVTWADTVANFDLDFGEPPPPLPQGINIRVYEPGIRHALQKDNDVVGGGPMPWPDGDWALDYVQTAAAAQEARQIKELTKRGLSEEQARRMLKT
jgi:hypothetical protein